MALQHPLHHRKERSGRGKSSIPSIPLCTFITELSKALGVDHPVYSSDDDLADNYPLLGSRDTCVSYLVQEIVSKFSNGTSAASAKEAAFEKFQLAEERLSLIHI